MIGHYNFYDVMWCEGHLDRPVGRQSIWVRISWLFIYRSRCTCVLKLWLVLTACLTLLRYGPPTTTVIKLSGKLCTWIYHTQALAWNRGKPEKGRKLLCKILSGFDGFHCNRNDKPVTTLIEIGNSEYTCNTISLNLWRCLQQQHRYIPGRKINCFALFLRHNLRFYC